jgi:antitoxin (DNA-binding transcriptional repressor) of toxin-antitoxin stability system
MGVLSVREFNANVSGALARVEAGEVLDITKNGRVIAELRPKTVIERDTPEWNAAFDDMLAMMRRGIPGLTGPASYEERTE